MMQTKGSTMMDADKTNTELDAAPAGDDSDELTALMSKEEPDELIALMSKEELAQLLGLETLPDIEMRNPRC
jgi:hypothetical protein